MKADSDWTIAWTGPPGHQGRGSGGITLVLAFTRREDTASDSLAGRIGNLFPGSSCQRLLDWAISGNPFSEKENVDNMPFFVGLCPC